jgi:hypothetical protein
LSFFQFFFEEKSEENFKNTHEKKVKEARGCKHTSLSLSLSLSVLLLLLLLLLLPFEREREKDKPFFFAASVAFFSSHVYARVHARAGVLRRSRESARGTFHDGERPRRRTHPSREEHLSFSFKEERKKDEAECSRAWRERERDTRIEEEELLFFAYFPPFFRLLFFEIAAENLPLSLSLFQNTLHHHYHHINNRALLKQKEKCR